MKPIKGYRSAALFEHKLHGFNNPLIVESFKLLLLACFFLQSVPLSYLCNHSL
jgi:hypothetical protein